MKRTPEEIEHDFDEMIDIRLDARNHSNYSVIEKTQADWEKIKKEYLDYALVLGTAVHRGSELYELGTLDETTVDPIVKKRLDQWLLFLESAEKKGWLQGERFIEKRLCYHRADQRKYRHCFGFCGCGKRLQAYFDYARYYEH